MRSLTYLISNFIFIGIVAIVILSAVVNVKGEGTKYAPLVNTPVGQIRGLRGDDGSSMYLGIPYAVVDEKNPFGPALPQPVFDGVYDAFNDSVMCPQMTNSPDRSINCLQLSVHVPETAAAKPLPVLVYIHGGRFMISTFNSRLFAPKFLIRHDVIFVVLNYRLSVYGFMCLHTPGVPGNQGLKDQLAALRWIKKNIRAFGGDDENITINGDSAGGVSVDLQVLFAEEGLFHKAIIQSGTSLSPWAYEGPDLDAAIKIADRLGFMTNDTDEAVSFLSERDPNLVTSAVGQIMMRFQPCIEKEFSNVKRFITRHPARTPLENQARRIPIIAGYTDDERLGNYYSMSPAEFERLDIFNYNMRVGFDFGDKQADKTALVRRFYAGDEPMTIKLKRNVIDFDSDCLFVHPTQRTLTKYLEYGGVAYHYVFSYIGGRNRPRMRQNITEGGALHSDEMGYLFDTEDLRGSPISPDDQLMIDRITTLWTNFAKYGNPTPSVTELLPVPWLPVSIDRLNYLNLTNTLELSARPFQKRLAFWDFFYRTHQEYIRNYFD